MISKLAVNQDAASPSQALAKQLKRFGLAELLASVIESGGTLNAILAQLLYVGQPVLDVWLSSDRLQALAALLEDEEERHAFIAHLRQGDA